MRTPRRGVLVAACGVVAAITCGLAPLAFAVPASPFPEYYGISPATQLDRSEVNRIGEGGAGTIRTPFYWPAIEPDPPVTDGGILPGLPGSSPESKNFTETDRLVGNAAQAGVRVMPFVYGTPDWVASDPARPPIDTAEGRAAWQDLLGDLVRRYGPGGEFWQDNPDIPKTPITDWQISNEPNSALFWEPEPSPTEYAQLLQLSGEAIRAADPNAAIVLAGMFGTPATGIEAWTFLDSLYQVPGITQHFDAYALHPYAPNLKGIEAQVGLVRDVLGRYGEKSLPLLISEIGWPTDGPAGYNLVKTPAAQKAMLAKAFKLFLSERRRWKIERVIWYTWRDNDVQPNCSVCRYSGLFTSGLEPKPAWRKFTQFAGGRP
jgi:polysaccharide biosynthesis protein PslG